MVRKITIGLVISIVLIIKLVYAQSADRFEIIINKLVSEYEEYINKELNMSIVLEGCRVDENSKNYKGKLVSILEENLIESPHQLDCQKPELEKKINTSILGRSNFLIHYIDSFKSGFLRGEDVLYGMFNPLYQSDVEVAVKNYSTKEEFFINKLARSHAFLSLLKVYRSILDEALGKNYERFSENENLQILRNIYLQQINLENLKRKINQDPRLKKCAEVLSREAHKIGFEIASIETTAKALMNQFYRPLLELWNTQEDKYKELLNKINNLTNKAISLINRQLLQEKNQEAILKTADNLLDFLKNPTLDKCVTTIQSFREQKETIAKSAEEVNRILKETWKITVEPAVIVVQPTQESIAVIPPIIFSPDHKGAQSFAQITPEKIFNEIKNFLFQLAPPIFILLLVIGAIFYLISPLNLQNIQTGSEYIKWAIIGYFLLLIITGIISAVKTIFGGP